MKYILFLSMFLIGCSPKFKLNDVVYTDGDPTPGMVREVIPHYIFPDRYIVCFQFYITISCNAYSASDMKKIDMTSKELWKKWTEDRQ